jgi:KaiC/GvpD/RAD55 family RecA-like ATPase
MDIQQETEYKWVEAAKQYEQVLKSEPITGSTAAEYWQRIGYCYELASRTADSVDDFTGLRQLSSEAYQKAGNLFAADPSPENQGKKDQCYAYAEYVRSWLASDSSEKIKILDNCQDKAKKAIAIFKTSGNNLRHGQTANLLTKCLFDRIYVTSSWKEKREFAREGIETSREAISALSKLNDKEELLTAFSIASIQAWYTAIQSESEEKRKEAADNSVSFAAKAIELSEEIANPIHKAISRWAAIWSSLYFTKDIEISRKYAKEMLEQASIVRDHYLLGQAFYMIAEVTYKKALGETNPSQRKQLHDEAIKNAVEGIRCLNLVFQDSLIAGACLLTAQVYSDFASDFSANLTEKIAYSKKAIDIGKKGLEHAIRSGSPEATLSTLDALSKAYHYHISLESREDYKRELLIEALGYRKELLRIARESFPQNLLLVGTSMIQAGQIETDQSRLEKDETKKIALLKEAITDMEQGVSLTKDWSVSHPDPSFVASLAEYEDNLGETLTESYSFTSESANLTRANEVYADAAEDFKKAELPSRVAESYWKIAKNLDGPSNFDQAARNFENALAAYKAAAQRTNQFSDFYLDHASYMNAWSEIESAKHAHKEEKYETATQHYDKASQLLRQSKSWSYLSQNFCAWTLLEQAEGLSRKENCEEAIEAFEKAIKSFQESKRTLNMKLEKIDKTDERNLAYKLIQVSETREAYSHGRIAIEEARTLYKKGDIQASSDKYGKAAAIFQEITLEDPEQTGKDAKPLAYLCQAWQKMTFAEARASPIMYEEASELFKLAKQHTANEPAGLIALGHSSYCKALEAGTEFEITRTMAMYEECIRNMGEAANFYLKAGYQTVSNHAKAIQCLLDAYVFMENAKRERDQKKQEKQFSMAEKALKTAVEYFEKAKNADKSEQTQKILQQVREERKLTLTLIEIFHAPDITSSAASFSGIAARDEKPVGLERFEHANLQARIVQQETEIRIGQPTSLKIQMINVGKEPSSLIRIENLVPLGFQIVDKPDYCQITDSQLITKGKRLDHVKTEEMKIALRSFMQGIVEIKPRIVYLDPAGHETTYNIEPLAFNVSIAPLSGRVPTGCKDLDSLLLGGIPEKYAVVLTSPSSDEREFLIRRFLEAGAKNGQITYYITAEIGNVADLAEEFQADFSLFVCNPRAEVMIKDLPNVFKIKGVENLTDIDIALVKSFRSLNTSQTGPRRACITIVSDVLLQHHAVITRKWLGGLLPDLKSRGFTTLALVNPEMHPAEEVQSILGLFEGEIRVSEKETSEGLTKALRIRKMYNQKYLETELLLKREKLEC